MLAGMPRNTMAATLMLSPGPSQRLGLVVTQSRPSLRNQGRQKPPKILTVPGDFWPFSGDSLQMHVPTWLKNNWLYSLKWCSFNFWIRPPSLAYCIAYGACAVGSASHFSQRELKSSVVFCHAHAFKLPWTCRPWGCASKKKAPQFLDGFQTRQHQAHHTHRLAAGHARSEAQPWSEEPEQGDRQWSVGTQRSGFKVTVRKKILGHDRYPGKENQKGCQPMIYIWLYMCLKYP